MEQRGTLKNWNDQQGFGFIRPQQGGAEVFAHISALRGERRPVAGDAILYIVGHDPKGRLRAEHVRLDAPMTLDEPSIRQRPRSPRSSSAATSARAAPVARPRRVFTQGMQHLGLKLLVLAGLCGLPLLGCWQLGSGNRWPVWLYLGASAVTFALYWQDKHSAISGRWRVSENRLHLAELLGGWPGALLAQQVFRHKTRKLSFQLLCWGIVLLHQVFWFDYLFLAQRFSAPLLQRLLAI